MTLGVDVVDLDRFRQLLQRQPGFAGRFFTDAERAHSARGGDPAASLAGTFAAKEAVMKALQIVPAVAWARRVRIERDETGRPRASVQGHAPVEVSISHDGPVAVAVAAATGTRSGGP